MRINFIGLIFVATILNSSLAMGASLKGYQLKKTLETIAKQSSEGTPRAINEDMTDMGYSVKGIELINHIAVPANYAVQIRGNEEKVRDQLGMSICSNHGFLGVLARSATVSVEFAEVGSQKVVLREQYSKSDCGLE